MGINNPITPASIGAVPTSRLVSTGPGIEGGQSLLTDMTINLPDQGIIGGEFTNPVMTVNNLGIIEAIESGEGGGSFVLIERQILVGASATITLGAGGTIPDTFSDLVIAILGRSTLGASDSTFFTIRFNGDSSANYYADYLNRFGHVETVAGTSMKLGAMTATTAPAGAAGAAEIIIPNYSGTTFQKQLTCNGGIRISNGAGGSIETFATGTWASTSAIDQIDLLLDGGNWDVGTMAAVYGRQ